MKRYIIVLIGLIAFNTLSFGQIKGKDVLFTVNNEPVFANEFIRVYNKNLDLVQDESQKDVDQYLNLFINYKLKLAEAKTLGFDKKPSYLREFESYKKQLSKNYLTDSNVTDALVKEAYDRISYDVYARHILVRIDAHEKDTTEAYNKILGLRERLLKEGFDKVKASAHNGNTIFVEDLGYFSGFKMVYEFENEAYKTPVGEVSKPFRTQFGYHVVEVLDKRKSRGEVTVGHIMVLNQQKDSTVIPEVRINEIYKLIQQGQEFEDLAKQFSEDQSSARNGGKLTPFKSGQLASVKFENEAFNMKNIGDISEPFQSDYGWHIIKLYEKTPLEPYEDVRNELEQRVKRDSRSKLINASMSKNLRKKYNVSSKNSALVYFQTLVDESYFNKAWNIPETLKKDEQLVTIGKKTFTYLDFANHLKASQKSVSEKLSPQDLINMQYDAFLDKEVLAYHEENLEFENEEFANILNEYREGLLLFDLMESKIWNAVKNDTIALKNYYEANKSKYTWPERIDAIVITSANNDYIKKAKKALENNMGIDDIKAQLNTKAQQNIIVTTGLMAREDQTFPATFVFKKGISEIYEHNKSFHVAKINEVLPESTKSFEDAQGPVISEYQTIYEDNWLKELTAKYKININKDVLEKVKSQIHN
ncbi:MAG: peptidylprolyl isomerase [Flavobacteriaceae bacterium]|nr:peptidylprolyl isomerase [Flavobacteriaceae bacterium]